MSTQQEIREQIEKAIGAHSLWKFNLRNAIQTGKCDHDVDSVRSSHNCVFGKWLDQNLDELRQWSECDVAIELHERFHRHTADILAKAVGGRTAEAAAEIESGSEYANISSLLTRTMMTWKGKVKG